MKLPVQTLDAESMGEIELDEAVFGLEPRRDILARVVNWQLAKRRAGTHKVKLIGDISGTTGKTYRQKGTGRARHGSTRAVQFRGGATAHGPVPRSHAHDLPKKVRRLGLKCALSAKQAAGDLFIMENLAGTGKTRDLARQLAALGFSSVLVIDGPEPESSLQLAARNLPGVDVLPQQGANVYDILRCDTLVLTRDAVAHLEARLK